MMIRYFCLVATGELGDVGYSYLRALEETGIRTRALPIGPASAMGTEKRWYDAGHLFTVPMSIPFVNVVCAPAGMMLGTRAPMKAMGGTSDLVKQDGKVTDVMVFPPELRALLGEQKDASDIVYEPQTALGGLYTIDCKNVAILCDDAKLDPHELAVLSRYDLVILPKFVPDSLTSAVFAECNINLVYVPPDPAQLVALLEQLLCA